MVELDGKDKAVETCRALSDGIRAIDEWCVSHEVDAWYKQAGYLAVATSSLQERAVAPASAVTADLGLANEYRALPASEVRARCNSPKFVSGGPADWQGPVQGFSVIEVSANKREGLPVDSVLHHA